MVYDFTNIGNFGTGILDDAARSVLAGVQVDSSTGNGIVIRANRVSFFATRLLPSGSAENGGYGVVVEPRYPASVVSNVYLGGVYVDGRRGGVWLDSLRTSTVDGCSIGSGGDGIDLIGSISTTITHTGETGNAGDGIKIVGGHDNVLTDDGFGKQNSPNKIGLVLRNSAFNTITGDEIRYNTGDGMLVVRGDHETIVDTDSYNNGGSGIHFKWTTASRVSGVNAGSNNGAGIWLDGSSGITVEDASSSNNSKSQVYIGCSTAQEPDGTTCASQGLPASNGNRVANDDLASSNTSPEPDVGIGIDRGNHHNEVLSIDATGNTTDAVDENTNCDSNQWVLNTFTVTSPAQPSCIQ